MRAHHQRGAVRWDIVKGLAPGIVLGSLRWPALAYSACQGRLPGHLLCAVCGFSATQMFLDKNPNPPGRCHKTVGQVAAGGVIGFLSGLVGAGGGFISVPFMIAHNVAIINVVATSAALGFPDCVGNTVVTSCRVTPFRVCPRIASGFVAAWFGGDCMLQCVDRAVGAKMAHALPGSPVERIFAVILYGLAFYMLNKGLRG